MSHEPLLNPHAAATNSPPLITPPITPPITLWFGRPRLMSICRTELNGTDTRSVEPTSITTPDGPLDFSAPT